MIFLFYHITLLYSAYGCRTNVGSLLKGIQLVEQLIVKQQPINYALINDVINSRCVRHKCQKSKMAHQVVNLILFWTTMSVFLEIKTFPDLRAAAQENGKSCWFTFLISISS